MSFSRRRLSPWAGGRLANLADYFAAGATALGVSTSLFGGQKLQEKNLARISENVKIFLEHCRQAKDRV